MKHLKRLALWLVLVFATGFAPAAFAQLYRQQEVVPAFSAWQHESVLTPAQERRMQDMERFFAKKIRPPEVRSVHLSFGGAETTFRIQQEMWSEDLGSSSVYSSRIALRGSRFVYTYRCSNIIHDLADGRALSPLFVYVSKKLNL